MIFATVGTQLPFPRLIDCLDKAAGNLPFRAFAQTADPAARPTHIECQPFLTPAEHEARIAECTIIVAHAGIGTVLAAKRARKPLIIFPRRAQLGEHRNEHQLATARFLEGRPGIYVASDAEQLESLLRADDLEPPTEEVDPAADGLIEALAIRLREWAGELQ